MTWTQTNASAGVPRLKRVLTRWDLIFYGIGLTTPIPPIPLYGIAEQLSRGHLATTILVAMLPMMFTAISYGGMATLCPSAGSAYTYVGRGLNPHLGFLTGWAMILDYIIQPLFNGIFCAPAIQRVFPQIPYPVLATVVIGFMTFLNLCGIRTTARQPHTHGLHGHRRRSFRASGDPLPFSNCRLARNCLLGTFLQPQDF